VKGLNVNNINQFLERDLGLKLISVGLAVLLWFQAAAGSGPALPQLVRDVPVQYLNLGQGLVMLSQPSTVNVTVRGRSDVLRLLTKDRFKAHVDLKNAGVGQGSFAVIVEEPEGVTVVQTTPAALPVEIDAWDNRQVPVQVYAVGSPAADHAMRGQTARPTDLYVEGPRSAVQLVSRVVAKVDISSATADLTRTVVVRPVDAEGAEVSGVTVTPSAVDVQIAIVQLPPARDVQVRANVQGRPAAGYLLEGTQVQPETVKVWASGAAGDGLRYLWTHPIDIEGATGTVDRDVAVLFPTGVENVEPAFVHVVVTIQEVQEERTFEQLPVAAVNLGSGLKVRFEPAQVDVIVRGARSLIATLTAEQVAVRADLTGLGAGTHEVALAVGLPEGFSVKSLSLQAVQAVVETQ
jgi:YbbR domain-containing protein